LIDIKEPSRGSLGAADALTIEQIVRQVRGRLPISVALAELAAAAMLAGRFAGHVQYAKVGLAGCRNLPDWPARWKSFWDRLPRGIAPVAVAYADWQTASAPDPRDVLRLAARMECPAVLIDTFDKSTGCLTDYLTGDALGQWIAEVRSHHRISVVAGRLDLDGIDQVMHYRPDYVAVRGAACAGDRSAGLDPRRVRQLAALVRKEPPLTATPAQQSAEGSAHFALARFNTRQND
jgi:uncharacterized protein (UPF0264 family)